MNSFLMSLLLALDLTASCEIKCFRPHSDSFDVVSMNYVSEDDVRGRFLCDPIFFRRADSDTLIIYVSGKGHLAIREKCDAHTFKSLECPDVSFELDPKNFCIWISFWDRRIKLSKNSMI